MDAPLFQAEHLYLSGVDPEEDAEVEAEMTFDLDYAHWFHAEKPSRPLSAAEVKKYYEETQKRSEGAEKVFHFGIRRCEDKRLIGFVRFCQIEWNHAAGRLEMAIGDPQTPESWADEALALALNYAFNELNLFRLAASTPAFDLEASRRYEKAGFTLEVRQREYVYREGRFWDWLLYGMLVDEWVASKGRV